MDVFNCFVVRTYGQSEDAVAIGAGFERVVPFFEKSHDIVVVEESQWEIESAMVVEKEV